MQSLSHASADYNRVEKAIKFLENHFSSQPGLKDIAAHIGLSEYHFQRLFSRWVGISPKRFLQFLTKEYAKQLLENSVNLLDVTYEAGLTSPGRLHDLFVTCEAVTPGEFKNRGEGLTITYPVWRMHAGDNRSGNLRLLFCKGRKPKPYFFGIKIFLEKRGTS
jgi:AraC family transcriptional regulator of adaptative response/methylated-DNA-[protein]-cysteine methyltransferase